MCRMSFTTLVLTTDLCGFPLMTLSCWMISTARPANFLMTLTEIALLVIARSVCALELHHLLNSF